MMSGYSLSVNQWMSLTEFRITLYQLPLYICGSSDNPHSFMKHFALAILLVTTSHSILFGQGTSSAEVWGGYIGSIRINDKWSVWNDFHYVPTAFWANRHGLSYRLDKYTTATAGYAFILTGTPFTEKLRRQEHRPWWQVEMIRPIGKDAGWRVRVRYDRRIRQALTPSDFDEGWIAYNRWRLMLSIRHKLHTYENGQVVQINLLNEILVNNGAQFTGKTLDQNRTYLMLSYEWPTLRVMFGPHLRAIPGSGDFFNYRYGLTCWVIHRFDPKKYWPQP